MAFHLRPSRTLAEAVASKDNGFNLTRLICALLVVVYHAFQLNPTAPRPDPLTALLAPHTDLGGAAVGVFFIISGMFITQSWMNDPHLLRFALRRVTRIVPGLFACLLLTTIVAAGFFSEQGWPLLLDPAPWRYIFGGSVLHGLQYIIPPQELRIAGVLGGAELNGPLWTLYWEGRMYVVLALVGAAALLPMRAWMRFAALFLLLAANLFPTVLSGYMWEVRIWSLFLTGVLLQTVAPAVRIGLPQVACAVALVALNWTRSMALTGSGLTWFGIALVICALGFWLGSARRPHWRHLQRHDYSYGVYIYHWPLLLMLRAVFPGLDGPGMLGAGLLLIVPVAMLSWHLVEQPCLRAVRPWLAAR